MSENNDVSQRFCTIEESFEGLSQCLQFIQTHWRPNYTLVIFNPSTCQSTYIIPTEQDWDAEILKIVDGLCHAEHTFPQYIEIDDIHHYYIIHMPLLRGRLQASTTYKSINGKLTAITPPKQQYNAYYDESSHSRKITTNTVNAKEFTPYFCAAVLCVLKSQDAKFQDAYSKFEQKYRQEFTILPQNELKSCTPFGGHTFHRGLNLDKSKHDFISEYLDLLIQYDIPLFIFYSHKIEYCVRQYCDPLLQDPQWFSNSYDTLQYKQNIYAMTKLLQKYHPATVLSKWNTDEFISETKVFLQTQYCNNQSLSHKDVENQNIAQILQWLEREVTIKTEWNYKPIFECFSKYAHDECMQIKKFDIDKEGNGKTKCAAQSCGFASACEIDSKKSIMIRATDIAAGLFGALLDELEYKTQYPDDNSYLTPQYLPVEWLPRRASSFELYKKLYAVLFLQHNSWHKVCAGYYNDAFAALAALLKEVYAYDTWEDYQKAYQNQKDAKDNQNKHLQKWEMLTQIELRHHWEIHGLA